MNTPRFPLANLATPMRNPFSLRNFRRGSAPLRIALAALLSLQLATPCQAGLFDWLFGRKEVQTVVCCQPATCAPCCTQRTVVNYAPETVYTTSWVRVPVTTYRPVTTTDPATCSQVRYMQPSTSYVWQARRQPHVIYKPFLSRIANACSNGSCSVAPAVPGVPITPELPVATPGTAGPLVTTPSTLPPTGLAPSTGAPIGSAVAPYATSPYPASPYGAPGSAPAGSEPADLAPRLDTAPQVNQRPLLESPYPYGTPFESPSTTYPPTTTYPPYPPTGSTAPIQTNRVPTEAPPNNGSNGNNSHTPLMSPPKNSETPAGTPPNPVPDPDSNNSTRRTPLWTPPTIPTPNVPRLLNPTDRTAALRPRIAAPVRWATVQPAVYRSGARRQPQSAPAVQTAPAQVDLRQPRNSRPTWDDGGWRPVSH